MPLERASLDVTSALRWRLVGPYRGGRVMAVAGHPHDPMVFYFGSSSGGVWKTDNGGSTWHNISDGFFKRGSVGALTLAPSDPHIIYVGMGECGMRSNVTHGDGVYRSQDGGATWQHVGLAETQNIGQICIHPRDPNLVYAAAFGHRFGPNPERGVYRSRDGGRTWEQVLFRGERAGAIDLTMDLTNPRVLYAAFWDAQLYPWGRVNSGSGSGLFKTTDGGDTWTELTHTPGFPEGPHGRIGICASPVRSGRIWAEIDAKEGGMYRSDDGGASWTWLSDDRNFLVRSWYFMHLLADPQDADTVYVVNRKLWKSIDGGRSYRQLNVPYVDEHALWVDPRNTKRMILGNDGGAAVSFNGGESWSTIMNQPTAEMYRLAADTHFPYRVYTSQQDNSTICLPSRSDHGPISQFDWYDIGGGESGAIAVRPDNPNIVYSGDLPGLGITRYDHATYQIREVGPWLDAEAYGDEKLKYRFNWTTPIVLSPHNPDVLYVAGNVLFRSTDEGNSWDVISPDLTRNDQEKLTALGDSITGENALVNDYCTISSVAESPRAPGVLWVGSDDGLVHVSRDNGATWTNVTPPDLAMWAITMVEPSAHLEGGVYLAASLHQVDDFQPYIFKTSDYGQSWQRITDGIPADEFVRVVREDPARQGLLYAGTEAGVYLSLNDGESWHSLQGNLPVVAIYDLLVHEGDLIAATHGRSVWMLDDLSPLHQLSEDALDQPAHLFAPRPVYRLTRQVYGIDSLLTLYASYAADNPPSGVVVSYHLKEPPIGEVTLALLDAQGREVNSFSSRVIESPATPIGPMRHHLRYGTAVLTGKPVGEDEPGIKWGPLTLNEPPGDIVPTQVGLNRFVLPLLYPGARRVPGASGGGITAPLALPGIYTVRLTVGDKSWTAPVEIRKDPRVMTSQQDLEAQFAFMVQLRDKVSEIHDAVNQIRAIRRQIEERTEAAARHASAATVQQQGDTIKGKLAAIEATLIQPNLHQLSGELAGTGFPPRLNVRLQGLGYSVARSDDAPTKQSRELYAELAARADHQLALLREVLANDLAAFNHLFRDAGIPAVSFQTI